MFKVLSKLEGRDFFLHLNFSHPSRILQMIDKKSLETRKKTNCSGTRLTAKHGRVLASVGSCKVLTPLLFSWRENCTQSLKEIQLSSAALQ